MRVWDLAPRRLCRPHLLGEHRELHAIWSILTNGKEGYRNHPETKRWKGRLRALFLRHERLVTEMQRRGYRHASPLDRKRARGPATQERRVHSTREQMRILRSKKCACKVGKRRSR